MDKNYFASLHTPGITTQSLTNPLKFLCKKVLISAKNVSLDIGGGGGEYSAIRRFNYRSLFKNNNNNKIKIIDHY